MQPTIRDIAHLPDFIQFVDNPSDELQWAAVGSDGTAIRHIDKPSKQIRLNAIHQNGMAIEHIKNPTDKEAYEAVKQNGWALFELDINVDKISEGFMLTAIETTPAVINRLDCEIDIPEDVMFEAVHHNPKIIKWITNPPQSVMRKAVQRDGLVVRYLINKETPLPQSIRQAAVKQNKLARLYLTLDNRRLKKSKTVRTIKQPHTDSSQQKEVRAAVRKAKTSRQLLTKKEINN